MLLVIGFLIGLWMVMSSQPGTTKKTWGWIITVVCLVLILAGCSPQPNVESGLVVDRRHNTNEYEDRVCDGGYVYDYNWQTGNFDYHYDYCASYHYEHRNDPDTWEIELQDCLETDHDPWDTARYSDCDRSWQTVSHEVHDSLAVGDWYGEGTPPEPCTRRQDSC